LFGSYRADKQTDKQTHAAENITSCRYATPVGRYKQTWSISLPRRHCPVFVGRRT